MTDPALERKLSGLPHVVAFVACRMRVAAGLSQRVMAERTGIHRPIIARIEAGRHLPRLITLRRYAKACGAPITDFAAAIDAHLGL